MEKKQSKSTAKGTPRKAKTALRKLTVRDLDPQKGTEIKGGTASYTITRRTR